MIAFPVDLIHSMYIEKVFFNQQMRVKCYFKLKGQSDR